MKCNFYTNLTNLLKKNINSKDFIEKYRQKEKDFKRNRILSFQMIILFTMNMIRSALQNELDKFFKILNGREFEERQVTASAFCHARKKIKHESFIDLNQQTLNYFYQKSKHKKWYGFRLVAFDGSKIVLPKNKQTIAEFGENSTHENRRSTVMALVSQAYDVLNHIAIDSRILPLSDGELEAVLEHLKYLDENDLGLMDRGYPSFWLFKYHEVRKRHFCARISINKWKVAKELADSGQKEKIVEIVPSHRAIRKCKELGLSIEPIKLRFICIDLDNGKKEVLITSLLDREKYPYEIFRELYHARWGVEESYKLMKHRIEIENFSGKSPEVIKQDFYARILTLNLSSIFAFPVHDKIKEKYT